MRPNAILWTSVGGFLLLVAGLALRVRFWGEADIRDDMASIASVADNPKRT
jgi:hypothetical protein